MFNYIYDFGITKNEEEKDYIHQFMDSFLNIHFSKKNKKGNKIIVINIISEAVYVCQEFIRNYSGISSVSLRDIKRFIILFEFFMNFNNNKKEIIFSSKELDSNLFKEIDKEDNILKI